MVKNIFLFLLISFFATRITAQDTSRILKDAKTISASAEDIKIANEHLSTALKNPAANDSLFNSFTLLGPRLWDRIKGQPVFAAMDLSDVKFKVPSFDAAGNEKEMIETIGKVVQSTDEFKKIWNFLYVKYDLAHAKIVSLTNKERFIFWLYFAKIEEPVICLQSSKARLLLKFVNGNLFFTDLVSEIVD
jgi:hypothetical protein